MDGSASPTGLMVSVPRPTMARRLPRSAMHIAMAVKKRLHSYLEEEIP